MTTFKIKTKPNYFNQGTASFGYKRYWRFKLDEAFTHIEIEDTESNQVRRFSRDEFLSCKIKERTKRGTRIKIYVVDYSNLLNNFTETKVINEDIQFFTQDTLAQRWNILPCRLSELHRFGILRHKEKLGKRFMYHIDDILECEESEYFKTWISNTKKVAK